MESWVQSWGLVPMRFAIVPVHVSKVLRLPQKVMPGHTKCCTCHTKFHLPKTEDLMLQNATSLRKSAPGPPNSPNISNEHVSCTAPATRNASLQILSKCPTPAIAFGNATKFLIFNKVHNPLLLPRKTTSEPSKVVQACGVTWKFALRHSGVHFFDMSTSKSGPKLVCFLYILTSKCGLRRSGVHFFDISTSKSGPTLRCFAVLCTFWLRHVLRATTVCTFSTSQLPKVLRSWGALYILTSKCAWRHNGVQFFLSHLAKWLRTRRFSEPTFRPSGATNHWKNTVNRDFSTFRAPASSFFWLFLFSDLLSSRLVSSRLFSSLLWLFPPLLVHLSILSEVWLLNFLRLDF